MSRISLAALDAAEARHICGSSAQEVAEAYRDGDHEFVSRMLTAVYGTDAALDSFVEGYLGSGGDPDYIRDLTAQLLVGAAMVGAHARASFEGGVEASEWPERNPETVSVNPLDAVLAELGMSLIDEDDAL